MSDPERWAKKTQTGDARNERHMKSLSQNKESKGPMNQLTSWWSSVDFISNLSSCARWAGAVIGILILVLGHRAETLKKRAREIESERSKAVIEEIKKTSAKQHADLVAETKMLKGWWKNRDLI